MAVDAISAASMLVPSSGAARPTGAVAPAAGAAAGVDFAGMVGTGLQQVQGMQQTSDRLAVGAATGDLTDVHDYLIAATQAQVATEVTVALRNKAVEAFSEIMRMQA